MELIVSEQQPFTVVKVKGKLDTGTADAFQELCLQLLADGKNQLALDFEQLSYLSSAGLRGILIAGKKAKAAKGKLVICHLSGMAGEVFSMSGFDGIFSVYKDLAELLAKG